ncbi:MAG TPA: LysM peptidoglycan-binding domain-containing protein, partial [Bacteroidia bacterium]|nr:LysM peptidoglycan-binding domain-containing protein [Bacteroidia bacterium]
EADTVMVDRKLLLRDVADAINVPVELLSYLNPVYKKGLIPDGDEPMTLRLPSNKINNYIASIDKIYQQQESTTLASLSTVLSQDEISGEENQLVKRQHKVRSGEHLQSIAKRYSCSVQELKRWNGLKSTKLKAGQKLSVFVNVPKKADNKLVAKPVPQKENATVLASVKADSATENQGQLIAADAPADKSVPAAAGTQNSKYIYHVVQPGDTLWKIAQRYDGMTVETIKQINRLRSNELKVGTKLKVSVAG